MFGGYFFLTDQQCFSEGAVNGYFFKKKTIQQRLGLIYECKAKRSKMQDAFFRFCLYSPRLFN